MESPFQHFQQKHYSLNILAQLLLVLLLVIPQLTTRITLIDYICVIYTLIGACSNKEVAYQIIIFLHLCCLYSHTMATLNALSNELSRLKIVVSESFMILVYAFGLLVYWRAYQFAVLKTFVVGESSEGSEQEGAI